MQKIHVCCTSLFRYHLHFSHRATFENRHVTLLKISIAKFIFPRKVIQRICNIDRLCPYAQGTYNGVCAPNLFDRSHGISTRRSR